MTKVTIDRELLERVAGMSKRSCLTAMDELRAILANPAQQGEAVEVVGYGCEGQIEVLKHVPLTGGMKVSGREREKYNVPLMTVAQHQRMMLALVARCYQEGAFKTCLECGYQDGHDQICQYHESKRAAASDDLTNVRCLCCQSEHAHNSYDAGFIAGSGMCQACDAAMPARGVPEGKEFSQFLSAVMDAAGLVRHGRQSKELSEYLGSKCMEYRGVAPSAGSQKGGE